MVRKGNKKGEVQKLDQVMLGFHPALCMYVPGVCVCVYTIKNILEHK